MVVAELPRRRDTLLARLLGAGETLRQAVRDLRALPGDAWEVRSGLRVLEVLRSSGRLPDDPIERDIVMEVEETHEQWVQRLARLKQEGLETGLAPLLRMVERKLARALTDEERQELMTRLERLGPERIGDVVLDLEPIALAAWLGDRSAR